MKNIASIILFFSILLPLRGEDNVLRFEELGFEIPKLAQSSKDLPQQALVLFLPVTDGFAPNVNVIIQRPFPGNIEEYAKLSKSQFSEMKWEILKEEKQDDTTVVFEYRGDSQGSKLHWYAKAIKKGDMVYLVTATAPDSAWETLSKKLIPCVEGFKLTN